MRLQRREKVPTRLVAGQPGHGIALTSKIGKPHLLLNTIGMGVYVLSRAMGSRNRPDVVTSGYAI